MNFQKGKYFFQKYYPIPLIFLISISFWTVIIKSQISKSVIQKELLTEITQVQNRDVTYIQLKEGTSPGVSGKCLIIKDPEKIQFVVDSLQYVSTERSTPFKNIIDLEFQLILFYSEGEPTNILGKGFEKYPEGAYIERNLWKKTGEKTYSYEPQDALFWPSVGPWLREKIKEADSLSCA